MTMVSLCCFCWLFLFLFGALELLFFFQVVKVSLFFVIFISHRSSEASWAPKSSWSSESLHGAGVETSESLVGIFLLLIFVDPLGPVNLNVLVFSSGLDEPRPEGGIGVFLFENEEEVEAGFGPLGVVSRDFVEEFELEGVFLASAGAIEVEVGGSEVDFLVGDVHERYFKEDPVLSLCPSDHWVAT